MKQKATGAKSAGDTVGKNYAFTSGNTGVSSKAMKAVGRNLAKAQNQDPSFKKGAYK